MGFIIRGACNKVKPLALIALLLSVSFLGSCSGGGGGGASPGAEKATISKRDKYLIGAHYYVWWPSNFDPGYLRAKLDPPQAPQLGEYNSSDPKVAEQHIAWASRYGIDFFTLDWWPRRPEQNRAITEGFLKAENISDIKFSLWLEPYEKKDGWGEAFEHGFPFTDSLIERYVSDIVGLADQFFEHPSYLKIDGRPVLFFYLVRNYSGDYKTAIKRLREGFASKGYNPLFIGDELFWDVVRSDTSAEDMIEIWETGDMGRMPMTNIPQMERIGLFDAITSYNMYNWAMYDHAGYGANSSYVSDVAGIWDRYIEAMDDKVDFIPNLLTGYNDRGIRPLEDHYAIPRQWKEGDSDGTFLAESFDRLGFPYSDPDLSIVLITSWNEWNEDTNIEPVAVAPATSSDETGGSLTQGYSYPGYGATALEAVQNKVASVSGRVTDQAGAAVWGAKVCGYKDRAQITCGTTNREGYYTLSRLKMPKDEYDVSMDGKEGAIRVSVGSSNITTDINFTR